MDAVKLSANFEAPSERSAAAHRAPTVNPNLDNLLPGCIEPAAFGLLDRLSAPSDWLETWCRAAIQVRPTRPVAGILARIRENQQCFRDQIIRNTTGRLRPCA